MKNKILNTVLSKVSSAGISFLLVILLSQVLGASGRGEATIILTSIALIIIACEFAGGGSLIYLFPRHHVNSLLITSYTWSLAICIIAGILLYFVFPAYSNYAIHLAAISLIYSGIGINAKVLVAKEQVARSNVVQLFQVLINLLSLLVLFYLFDLKTIQAYISSLYISGIGAYLLSIILILPLVKSTSNAPLGWEFRKILSYGAYNQLAQITQFLSWRISYYLIEEFAGDKTLGVYSNAVSIAESIWLISRSVALVQYSKITNTSDDSANRLLTIKLSKFTVIVSVIILVPLLLLPSSFYTWIFGPEFYELPFVIKLLAPGILIFEFALIFGHYFSGSGRYGVNAFASGCGLIVTLILGIILIPDYPLVGSAIVSTASYLVTAVIVMVIFFKNNPEPVRSLLPAKNDFLLLKDHWNSINPFK